MIIFNVKFFIFNNKNKYKEYVIKEDELKVVSFL